MVTQSYMAKDSMQSTREIAVPKSTDLTMSDPECESRENNVDGECATQHARYGVDDEGEMRVEGAVGRQSMSVRRERGRESRGGGGGRGGGRRAHYRFSMVLCPGLLSRLNYPSTGSIGRKEGVIHQSGHRAEIIHTASIEFGL